MNPEIIPTKNLVVKSNLPEADYVINPYVGCRHNCLYCYANFMKRFYKIEQKWGEFAIPKEYVKIDTTRLSGKKVLLSSVTDPYQPLERKYKLTQKIIEDFVGSDVHLEILTKSNLVLRDLEILKKIKNLTVGISVGLKNAEAVGAMELGCISYEKRVETLRILKKEGIRTYTFISPIFPKLTDVYAIIEDVAPLSDYIFFESLNLRGGNKAIIFEKIAEKFPSYLSFYRQVYNDKEFKIKYWEEKKEEIEEYLKSKGFEHYTFFFNH